MNEVELLEFFMTIKGQQKKKILNTGFPLQKPVEKGLYKPTLQLLKKENS